MDKKKALEILDLTEKDLKDFSYIKKKYRKLASNYHPDNKNLVNSLFKVGNKSISDINTAYQSLESLEQAKKEKKSLKGKTSRFSEETRELAEIHQDFVNVSNELAQKEATVTYFCFFALSVIIDSVFLRTGFLLYSTRNRKGEKGISELYNRKKILSIMFIIWPTATIIIYLIYLVFLIFKKTFKKLFSKSKSK